MTLVQIASRSSSKDAAWVEFNTNGLLNLIVKAVSTAGIKILCTNFPTFQIYCFEVTDWRISELIYAINEWIF